MHIASFAMYYFYHRCTWAYVVYLC